MAQAGILFPHNISYCATTTPVYVKMVWMALALHYRTEYRRWPLRSLLTVDICGA